MEWEEVCMSHISGSELVYSIYKELRKLNTKKSHGAIKKLTLKLKGNFLQDKIQMSAK